MDVGVTLIRPAVNNINTERHCVLAIAGNRVLMGAVVIDRRRRMDVPAVWRKFSRALGFHTQTIGATLDENPDFSKVLVCFQHFPTKVLLNVKKTSIAL